MQVITLGSYIFKHSAAVYFKTLIQIFYTLFTCIVFDVFIIVMFLIVLYLLDDLLDKLKLVLAEHFRFLSGKDNLFLYIFWK